MRKLPIILAILVASWLAPTVSEAQTGNNFTVTSFSASPNPVQPGGVLTVSATIGSSQAASGYTIGFLFFNNGTVYWSQSFQDISLPAGSTTENATMPIPASLPPGTYQVTANVWSYPSWVWQAGAQTTVTVSSATTAAAPVNVQLPVISGTAQVGSVLTSSTGTWTGATSYAYQWADNGTPISGATNSTYTAASSDAGNTLTSTVTATGPGGTASATSAPTSPIVALSTSSSGSSGGGGGGSLTYYVSTSGSDSNSGSATAPWRTIGHAAATVTAGATVIVQAGTYNEQAIPANSGTNGSPITYEAAPGAAVYIDGTGKPGGQQNGIFQLNTVNYINIYGFNFVHGAGECIYTFTSTYINIAYNSCNSSFDTAGQGGVIANWWGTNINIFNNYIHNTGTSNFAHAIEVAGSGYVNIHDNIIDLNQLGDGIVAKNGGANLNIYNNQIYNLNPSYSVCIDLDPSVGSTQYGTVLNGFQIYNNMCGGASNQSIVFGLEGSAGTIENGSITNNTLPGSITNQGETLVNVVQTPNTITSSPPTLYFSASQYTVSSGGSVVLSWTPHNASSCSASGGWSGNVNASNGTYTGTITNLTATTPYTLSCSGPGSVGSVSYSLTVTVQ